MTPEIHFSREPDARYLQLIWEEFFLSRGRGISLEAHFPWLTDLASDKMFATLTQGDRLAGGLVLRGCSSCMRPADIRAAAIGLVCIPSDLRGAGIGSRLVSAAVRHAQACGLQVLTLWSNKHAFYERVGFRLADRALFGWVKGLSSRSEQEPIVEPLSASLGLPPFARAAGTVRSGNASCRLLRDAAGWTLCDYAGPPREIADLLESVMPSQWRLNTLRGDPLRWELSNRGYNLRLKPTHLQMWLPLNNDWNARWLSERSNFTVFDRI